MWWEYFESFRDDFVKINIEGVSLSFNERVGRRSKRWKVDRQFN